MDHDNKIKTDEQVTTESDPSKVDGATTEDTADPKLSRRRALIAGLAAAPVIFSLMNRNALAQTANVSNCNLVRSYAAAGYKWTSPAPATLTESLRSTWGITKLAM
jgi:hypothetical protein